MDSSLASSEETSNGKFLNEHHASLMEDARKSLGGVGATAECDET